MSVHQEMHTISFCTQARGSSDRRKYITLDPIRAETHHSDELPGPLAPNIGSKVRLAPGWFEAS